MLADRLLFQFSFFSFRPVTLQAMTEEDMRLWLDVMDGKEPVSRIVIHVRTWSFHEFNYKSIVLSKTHFDRSLFAEIWLLS